MNLVMRNIGSRGGDADALFVAPDGELALSAKAWTELGNPSRILVTLEPVSPENAQLSKRFSKGESDAKADISCGEKKAR